MLQSSPMLNRDKEVNMVVGRRYVWLRDISHDGMIDWHLECACPLFEWNETAILTSEYQRALIVPSGMMLYRRMSCTRVR